MLKSIRIKNFVLVKEMHINFADKLTVLTGETGAGKSVIAGALHLVLGEQLKSDIFFDDSLSVELEAVFDISNLLETKVLRELLDKYGIDIETANHPSQEVDSVTDCFQPDTRMTPNTELFFFREIKPDNRSSIYINGRKSTNSIVKEFRHILLDFHSQRDQQSLFDEQVQLLYLDSFANLFDLKEDFLKHYNTWLDYKKKIKKYQDEIQKNKDKILLFEYQIEELETANLKENEEFELDKEYHLLSNAKEILDLFYEMKNELFEADRTVYDILGFYKNKLQNYTKDSKLIEDIVENLNTCISAIENISVNSRYIDDQLPTDEKRIIEVEARLKIIYDLKTKYKKSISQMNEYLEEMKSFIVNYEQNKDVEEEYTREIGKVQQKTYSIAFELEQKRVEAGSLFENKIKELLSDLAINDADFKIIIDRIDSKNFDDLPGVDYYDFTGFNRVKYVFSANKGMALQELKSTISGGELSRLLLVIKSILAKKIPERTIIFDEIDAGIGGKTANKLGKFIKNLSVSHQILCISHLPQIAAIADQHLRIEKINQMDKSVITMKVLDLDERKVEIARMLAGNVTDTALNHANELLQGIDNHDNKMFKNKD